LQSSISNRSNDEGWNQEKKLNPWDRDNSSKLKKTKPNSKKSLILKDEIEKKKLKKHWVVLVKLKIQLKKDLKNESSQHGLTCQKYDFDYEIEINS
jgi:hypothetical protein